MLLIPIIAALVLGWALARTRFCFYRTTELRSFRSNPMFIHLLAVCLLLALIHGAVILFSEPEIPVNRYAFKHSMWIGCFIFAWGVWVNRACTWGSLVQLGERNWTYMFTFAGLYVGVVSDGFWGKALDPIRVSGIEENAWQYPSAWLLFCVGVCILYFMWKRIPFKSSNRALLPWLLLILSATALTYCGNGIFTNNAIRFVTSLRDDHWTYGLVALATILGAWIAGLPAKSVQLKWRNIPRHFFGGFLMGVASFMIPGGTEEWILRDTPFLLTQGWIALLCISTLLLLMHFIFSRLRPSIESPM